MIVVILRVLNFAEAFLDQFNDFEPVDTTLDIIVSSRFN